MRLAVSFIPRFTPTWGKRRGKRERKGRICFQKLHLGLSVLLKDFNSCDKSQAKRAFNAALWSGPGRKSFGFQHHAGTLVTCYCRDASNASNKSPAIFRPNWSHWRVATSHLAARSLPTGGWFMISLSATWCWRIHPTSSKHQGRPWHFRKLLPMCVYHYFIRSKEVVCVWRLLYLPQFSQTDYWD